MARLYKTTAWDSERQSDRDLWCAETSGQVIATGDTAEEAAEHAHIKLTNCAAIAKAHKLPNRYIRRLLGEAEVFRPR